MRIALAEDEPDIAAHMQEGIARTGIVCNLFVDGPSLVNGLQRGTYDVVLADWNIPEPNGIEVVRWAQNQLESPPPFVMLTSRSDADDIVEALEAGACDYIVKPEDIRIVVARLKAAARRGTAPDKERVVTYGRYSFDRLYSTATLDDEPIKLTAKEFELALTLFQNRDRPLARSYLLGEVWGANDQVETRTLDMHVSRVRNKLRLNPENGFVIQSVFGFGYRLEGYADGEEAT